MKLYPLSILLIILLLASCEKESFVNVGIKSPKLPEQAYDYKTLNLPANTLPGFSNLGPAIDILLFDPAFGGVKPNFMEVTDLGATLGRVLFYDTQLSINNTIACASCHHQDKSFSDGLALSQGFEGKATERSSMAIINPIIQNNLFWDSRSFSIQDLSLKPVQNHIEMGMEKLDRLQEKISNVEFYKPLFKDAYGSSEVTTERISNALSQFVASITSNGSKFDTGKLSSFELQGQHVFQNKCGSCHSGSNFSADDGPGGEYGVLGGGFGGDIVNLSKEGLIDINNNTTVVNLKGTTNIGLDLVSKDTGFEGRFRIPTLRNIMLTAPYMHDGRFKTIDEVLDHYSKGIKPNVNLDKKFKTADGKVKFIALSSSEREALKSFLGTLTDYAMVSDPKYSNPFK